MSTSRTLSLAYKCPFHQQKQGSLGKMANARSSEGTVQKKPTISSCSKKQRWPQSFKWGSEKNTGVGLRASHLNLAQFKYQK